MRTLILFSYLFATIACTTKPAESQTVNHTFPVLIGYVNDFAGVLTAEEVATLDKTIFDFEKETTNEIAIVTVDSITPYTSIAKYGTDLSNAWGIGKKDKDNGLLIVFCRGCREVRIATGLSTEKILTDSLCQEIIDQQMIPAFKQGNYYQGLEAGVEKLIEAWHKNSPN